MTFTMLKVIGLFVHMCAMCAANVPAKIKCGPIPDELYPCAHLPVLLPLAAGNKCEQNENTPCKIMTCIFREAGWVTSDGATVNTVRLRQHLDRYMVDHKDWSTALQRVKTNCTASDLPAQGYNVKCRPLDIAHCLFTQLVKNVPDHVWTRSPDCDGARQFAEKCPMCPYDCFAPKIPLGSCNACKTLPHHT